MLQSAGGDSGPLLVFLHPLELPVLCAQQCPAVPSGAGRLQLLKLQLRGPEKRCGTAAELLHPNRAAGPEQRLTHSGSCWSLENSQLRTHNCLSSSLCCPLLRSLLGAWCVCKVIGLHYLIYEVGVGGRVREDELK